ncbi:tetratricopeptide repeat protein [Rhodomicrobium lacus]|uniref:tetratricopeptide repeat protein n=1 Tax=Rhodomicrobium lacus TaxID=2498452 RepID=UPI0026E359AB|nr:tetratricopeptide repeat protein [Rhodomicrobium lacus]WKW49431.1 tetratricopeptide repeat protein [Rhodomicrobium lacus]
MDIQSVLDWLKDAVGWADIVKAALTLLGALGVFALARRLWAIFRTPKGDGAHFTLLVAQLDGDADGRQTRHVIAELRKQFPTRGEATASVIPYPDVLAIGPGEVGAAEAHAEKRGRDWLKAKNADVLIWGEVAAHDKVLRLRFLAPAGEGGGAKPYALSSTLELPENFTSELGAALAVQATALIAPIYENAGQVLAGLIAPAVAKLKPLAENPPASFSDEARAQLWHAYATANAKLGEERGDSEKLKTAIAFYLKTLTIWTRERVPLDWATTQNNLGTALSTLGARESGTGRLDEAVAAYREALKEWTRERVPLDWATTQNNLGTALGRLGERESGTARLNEAVSAYREALKEFTRERVPLQWATTQNNLGNALQTLGERESSTARLDEAVSAYREALKEWTRESVPLDWAGTQNNLGNALLRLGERETGTARLDEAVAAYREALKERTHERVPFDWAMTQNNLGNALQTLGARESDTARLEEAVAAYREALKERARERVPLDWAMTQNNLGTALRRFGEREADKAKGRATLKEARGHYTAALEVFEGKAEHYAGLVRGNISRIDEIIAKRGG